MSERKPWHKQPKETDAMFEYFQTFLHLEKPRRLLTVAEKYTFSEAYMKNLSRRWDWFERAEEYDNYLIDVKQKAINKEIEKQAQSLAIDWLEYEREQVNKTKDLTDKFFAKAAEILALPAARKKFERKPVMNPATGDQLIDENGEKVYKEITIIQAARFSYGDAARFTEAGIILTDYVIRRSKALTPADLLNTDLPLPPKPWDKMSEEEIDEYAERIQAAKLAITKGEPIELKDIQ